MAGIPLYLILSAEHPFNTRESSRLPEGSDALPLRVLKGESLSVVVGSSSRGPFPSGRETIEAALRYGRAVESFHREGAVLPVRFGTFVDDEKAALALLDRHRARFEAALLEVEGCLEMGLRILTEPEKMPDPSASDSFAPTGKGYLLARRAQLAALEEHRQSGEALLSELRRQFDGLYVRTFAQEIRTPAAAGASAAAQSLSFLIPRSCERRFRLRFRSIAETFPQSLMMSGPWPPYSFAPALS